MRYDKSLELFDKALQLIPAGSQTSSKRPQAFAYGAYPIYAKRADGCRIEDIDGNVYIDFVNALGPIVLGYNYPAVQEAIAAQLEKGIISGLLWPAEVEAAELLTKMIPCAEMVRYFKGGGEATSAAARLVRAYTGREVILNSGYRGWPDVWAAARNEPGVPSCLSSTLVTFPFGNLEALEQKLEEHKGKVAAVFLDITSGSEATSAYLQAAKELAHKHGALFCMDEIVTGFRLAPGGAQEYFGVTPDLAVFAKGIANGMPVSCVAGRRDVMQKMAGLTISITYGGEALSLAAAVATMREIKEKKVTDYLWQIGRRLMDGLNRAAANSGIPFTCLGLAPMSMMKFSEVSAADNQMVWSYFLQEMAARGVLMRRGGLNFVTYSHTEADIDQVVAAAADVFAGMKEVWNTPLLAQRVKVREVNVGHRSFSS
ncbi:MAG TPA: aminotransferase class III-fold pyridoxal phosphate-dependent enzyme [Firmicutes bacterium]|nr:aminotransferase class III-fold pyridoxal phosphate-dependent enzyme [Bacillota bacterium]